MAEDFLKTGIVEKKILDLISDLVMLRQAYLEVAKASTSESIGALAEEIVVFDGGYEELKSSIRNFVQVVIDKDNNEEGVEVDMKNSENGSEVI